jgi:hypothetical protein
VLWRNDIDDEEPLTTNDPIVFAPAPDILWREVSLDHRTEVSLFGVPITVESNSGYTIEIADELFGRDPSCDISRDGGNTHPPLRLRVIIEPTRTPFTEAEVVLSRVPGPNHVVLKARGVAGLVDLAAGECVLYVEEAYARARNQFRTAIVRSPILTLVTRRDRHPVHAAGLRSPGDDSVLLLCGPSGTGKSTLCYAASRAGIEVFSDDAVRVQLTPELRVWGGGQPGRVHLLDDAVERFAVPITDGDVELRPNGKAKHVVSVPTAAAELPPYVRRARVCLLSRGRGPVTCEPVTSEEIARAILGAPEVHCDVHPEGRGPAVAALAAPGGWRLTLSDDADEALPFLLALLRRQLG